MKALIIYLVLILVLISCDDAGNENGNGNISKFNLNFDNITRLEIKGTGNLYLEQGSYNFEIETDENLHDNIKTEVKGNTLEIYLENGDPSILNYNFTLPEIESLELSGSINILARRKINSESLEIGISGSSQVYFDSLFSQMLNVDISGSGTLGVDGEGNRSNIDISGSGEIQFLDFPNSFVKIEIAGSGRASLNVIDTLDVIISGSGRVDYVGNPFLKESILGSGSVNKSGN